MKKINIKDIFVVALCKNGRNPIGEACYNDQAYSKMTPDDRVKMMDRLIYNISILMKEAKKTHLASYKKLDTNDVDTDFITRLSTNEFFFYTSAPLTLKEFECLVCKFSNC